MADAVVQIAPDSTGKFIDAFSLTNGSSQTVYRQGVVVADSVNTDAAQTVRAGNVGTTASDGAAVVAIRPDTGGSAGADFSANAPSWPVVGSNFSASGIYASWFLLKTVAANPSRLRITVDNMDAAPILVIRDDGTATSGNALVNATGFTLNPKTGTGPEGGHYESPTFRGRLQIYGASSSQSVAISTD